MTKILILILMLLLIFLLIRHRESISSVYKTSKARKGNTIVYSYKVENREAITEPWYTQKIPFKIHQTSFSRNMDYRLSTSCIVNHNINPEYQYYFYDDADVTAYIKENFPQYLAHYNSMKPGAYKADLFRLLVLYKEGGVYIDCKSSGVAALREMLRSDDEIFMTKDLLKGCIYQGFICSVPGHELMKKFIDKFITNIENKSYGINCFDIGGPQMIGRVLNAYTGKGELDPIEEVDVEGVRVGATIKLLEVGTDLITSMDSKKIYFERANPDYYKKKVKSMLMGKEYGIAWVTGRVYE